MAKNHTYVLGINAYDHDVSACLLRDGEIAFAINKERLTRKKHDGGEVLITGEDVQRLTDILANRQPDAAEADGAS